MHWLFAGVDRADTKNMIRDMFQANLAHMGMEISRSKADRLAQQFKRGRLDEMNEDLRRVLSHADITGETAVNRVLQTAR